MSSQNCISSEQTLQHILGDLVQVANERWQFSQRETDLNAERFVQTLVLGWLRQGDASLNDLAYFAQDLGIGISGSALHERITPKAVALLGEVLMNALRQISPSPRLPLDVLSGFTAVHVTDSTQVALPQTLVNEFAGTKGNAMLKLQVTLDYLTGQWVALELADGKSPDQTCDLPLQQAVPDSLSLFDLGYFKQERLRDMDHQDAYFVSRYQSQTGLYDLETHEKFDLVEYIHDLKTDEAQCQLALGQRVHLPVRLVLKRLPQSIADARRRKAKKKAKKNNKTCSKRHLTLLDWDILITNLPPDDWSVSQVFCLYPIRTQIEWLFRIWKSQLKINHFGAWRRERVLTQLYAHLIGALLCHRLTAGWQWRNGQEYSFSKCVRIIQHASHDLIRCFGRAGWGLKAWVKRLESAFRQFGYKTKRQKDPSTCQILMSFSLS